MKLKVNKDKCTIIENEIWNVGDYNVHTVQVELSPEFNGLVNKVRYFVENNSYDMLITDNVAQVPYEATVMEGTIKIGVYGYDADTNILVQSTSPVNKYISSGTYTGEADNTEPLTPTDKEQMETAIQKNTNDITDLKENKQDKLISGVNIKTINNESILSSGNITLVTEETDPIFTNSPAYSITDNDITYWNNKLDQSDLTDYVKNTDYASSSKGGVIKTGSGTNVDNNGIIYADNQTYLDYSSSANTTFISKGTLENVITGKNLETANNKVTSISSSSTDVQYPSAKCVYDNDVIIKDDVNTKYDYLFSLTNLFGKITGTGTSVTLNDTSNTIMKLNLDTTTSSQEGTPSPSNPQTIHTINGNNEIKINNKNLLNISSNSVTNRGVTVSINNNNLKILGTASQNYPVDKNVMPLPLNNIIPAGTYTFSVSGTYNGTANKAVNWELLDENDNLITGFSLGDAENKYYQNVTTSVPIAKIKFYRNMTQNITIDFNLYIQLEEGSTPTTFEKFKQQTYPINLGDIELCKIGDYKDLLFKNTLNSEYYNSSLELNKWYLKKNIGKVVFDGNTVFSNSTTNENFSSFFVEKNDMVINKTIMSNYFTQIPIGNATSASKVGIASHNTLARIYVTIPTSDVPISTFMSTHNTIVYYPLATPTYTLLNDTLQTQLDNLQYAMAYDNQTYITQTNTDLGFTINAETFAKIGG